MGLGQHQAMAILKRVNVHHAVSTLVLVQFERWNLPGKNSKKMQSDLDILIFSSNFAREKYSFGEGLPETKSILI